MTTDEEAQSTSPVTERTITYNTGVNQCIDINRYSKLTKLYRVTAPLMKIGNSAVCSIVEMFLMCVTDNELNKSVYLW